MENIETPSPEEPVVLIVPASIAKRFINYIIDLFIFSFLFSFLLVLVSPVYPMMQKIMAKQPLDFMDQFMIWFVYGLFMSIQEAILKGKSIGKYVTATRAVTTEDGIAVNGQAAFFRGLIRMIPFEQLSAISNPSRPWHDRWSKTIVADENKSILP